MRRFSSPILHCAGRKNIRQAAAIRQLASALGNVKEMSLSISAATVEQTTNTRQVSKAVENVNELTQGAASAAQQMSASTVQLSTMALELQRLVSQFRIDGADGSATGSSAVASASVQARPPNRAVPRVDRGEARSYHG